MMRTAQIAGLVMLLALTACDVAKDSVPLKGGLGTLKFVDEQDGGQSVLLCRDGGCRKAPDSEYKTDRGRTIPVYRGRLRYEEYPAQVCKFDVKDDRHLVNCKDKR